MKQKLNKLVGGMLLILVIGSLLAIFASPGVLATISASPVRDLPARVMPGQQFQVTVNFTSPAANFNAIGLDDVAPAGWTVSVNKTWNTPAADVDHTPNPNEAAYIWFGPYAASVGFTAVYNVQVPGNATLGNYTFTGTLEYYVGTTRYLEAIAGDTQVEVALPSIGGNTRAVNCDILTGVNVTAYQGAVAKASNLSDGSGNYALTVPALGSYNVTASKAGFRSETQNISVTESIAYTLDFRGDHGLIPNAPDMSYVLACVNQWKFGTPPCQLSMSKVLAVINAWKYPPV
jgi:hypothetical protein